MLYPSNIDYSRAITVRRALKWINIASITETIIAILSMAIIFQHDISILTPIARLSSCRSYTFRITVCHIRVLIHTDVAHLHIEGKVDVVQDGCWAVTRVTFVIFAHIKICSIDQRGQKEISKCSTLADTIRIINSIIVTQCKHTFAIISYDFTRGCRCYHTNIATCAVELSMIDFD